LTLAAAQHPGLRDWSQIDERSAGFFALGLAKATRTPVALVCTSGTAAANFHPAVIEAFYAGVPLLVLTADRPPELREWGAGQTIDQTHLYGNHVRWFAETAVPEGSESALRYAREIAARAVAEASGLPAGPVHLNLPFREPLVPAAPAAGPAATAELKLDSESRSSSKAMRFDRGVLTPRIEDARWLIELGQRFERGVIACGPMDAEPLRSFARAPIPRVLQLLQPVISSCVMPTWLRLSPPMSCCVLGRRQPARRCGFGWIGTSLHT
jgi:2-succinyl-5-enolpyruvyl-6-hydroxy-3-cyclohexene-1-carboxylate synthase